MPPRPLALRNPWFATWLALPVTLLLAAVMALASAGNWRELAQFFYRTPFGAVTAGTSVRLRFRTAQADAQSVTLFYYQFDPATPTVTVNGPVYPSFVPKTDSWDTSAICTSTQTRPRMARRTASCGASALTGCSPRPGVA